MKFLLVALLVALLAVLLFRGQNRQAATPCQSMSCQVNTPVMMPYGWEFPIPKSNYKYF